MKFIKTLGIFSAIAAAAAVNPANAGNSALGFCNSTGETQSFFNILINSSGSTQTFSCNADPTTFGIGEIEHVTGGRIAGVGVRLPRVIVMDTGGAGSVSCRVYVLDNEGRRHYSGSRTSNGSGMQNIGSTSTLRVEVDDVTGNATLECVMPNGTGLMEYQADAVLDL